MNVLKGTFSDECARISKIYLPKAVLVRVEIGRKRESGKELRIS